MKINEMKTGDKVQSNYLVNKITRGVTQTGSPYISVTMQDSSGEIEGKFWDVSPQIEAMVEVGKVFEFKLDIIQYRGTLQARIHNIEMVSPDAYSLDDFVKTGGYEKEYLKAEINRLRSFITEPILKKIVDKAFDYYGEDIYLYPAATRNHHDFVGGLAAHMNGMGKLVLAITDIYDIYDRDLLLSGVLLHDLGKIEEYTSPVLSEYTPEGKLIGHISIMHGRVLQWSEELGIADEEKILMLRHLILSHHGEYEYGSPVLPLIKEAEVLHFVDNLDARTNMFTKVYETLDEGSFSTRVFALNNRAFYKENKNK